MSCKTYDPCRSNNLNQVGSYAATAGQYAQQAQQSATNAATSATQASTAQAEAQQYAIQAAASASISGIYLGAKSTAPVVDNQGNPLQEGMQYFNTVDNTMYVWDGTSWITATGFNETTNFLAIGTTTTRDLQERFADVVNVKDFGAISDSSITTAISAAVSQNKVIGVDQSITVKIPTSAATLQVALDRLTPLTKQTIITLQIEAGHSLTAGVSLQDKDYSQFVITSIDSQVPISFNGNIFTGTNVKMPRLSCLINAITQASGNGIELIGSEMFISQNCGIINSSGTGLKAFYASKVSANNTIWTGSARVTALQSGIVAWASYISALGADCSNSGYYGAQSAHGSILEFREGKANNCYRHGIRATDASFLDADQAQASGCGIDGGGSNVRAFSAGVINFTNGIANNNQATSAPFGAALVASGAGSSINAQSVQSSGNLRSAIYAENGGHIRFNRSGISGASFNYTELDGLLSYDVGVGTSIKKLSGTYIPTITNDLNVSSSTAYDIMWSRVQENVFVSGVLDITAASTGNFRVQVSLPIPTQLTSFRQCCGSGSTSTNESVSISGNTTLESANISGIASTTTSQRYNFTFGYLLKS